MLPVQRTTRAQGGSRRSHDSIRATEAVSCPDCGSNKLPHAACRNCGYVRPGLRLKLSKKD